MKKPSVQFHVIRLKGCIFSGRLVFHGRGFLESYYTQKEETKPYIEWFVKERLGSRWLAHLETVLAANDGGKG